MLVQRTHLFNVINAQDDWGQVLTFALPSANSSSMCTTGGYLVQSACEFDSDQTCHAGDYN